MVRLLFQLSVRQVDRVGPPAIFFEHVAPDYLSLARTQGRVVIDRRGDGPVHDEHFAKRVRDSFGRQNLMALLGAHMTRIDPGIVEIELPFRRDLTQQHGYFHAGATSATADTAGGYAGFTLFPAVVAVSDTTDAQHRVRARPRTIDLNIDEAVGEFVRLGFREHSLANEPVSSPSSTA